MFRLLSWQTFKRPVMLNHWRAELTGAKETDGYDLKSFKRQEEKQDSCTYFTKKGSECCILNANSKQDGHLNQFWLMCHFLATVWDFLSYAVRPQRCRSCNQKLLQPFARLKRQATFFQGKVACLFSFTQNVNGSLGTYALFHWMFSVLVTSPNFFCSA